MPKIKVHWHLPASLFSMSCKITWVYQRSLVTTSPGRWPEDKLSKYIIYLQSTNINELNASTAQVSGPGPYFILIISFSADNNILQSSHWPCEGPLRTQASWTRDGAPSREHVVTDSTPRLDWSRSEPDLSQSVLILEFCKLRVCWPCVESY